MKFFFGFSVLLLGSLALQAQPQSLPNLTPNPGVESLGVYIKTVNVSPSDCAVTGGVITPGKHKILVFAVGVYNIGDADLDLGDPSTSPGFINDSCNGQFRYSAFVRLELLHGTTVVRTRDYAMCVQDFSVIPGAPATGSDGFNCASDQGITVGWRAFSMYNGLAGPFLMIDGVAAGTYTLRQTVNPNHVIEESDETDNVYQFTVRVK